MPGPHTHIKHELRFTPQYHTSYKWGLSLSPVIYKCHLKVLCPVRRPKTTVDCVLLKDNNCALVAKSDPEINSQACLYVLQGPCQITKCWLSIHHLIFLLMFCLETPKKGSGPTNFWAELFLVSLLVISSHPSMPRDPVQPHSVPGTWIHGTLTLQNEDITFLQNATSHSPDAASHPQRLDTLIIPLHKSQSLLNGKCWLPKRMAVVTCAHLRGRHVRSDWSFHFRNKHRSWRWCNLCQVVVCSTGLHNHLAAQQVCWTNRYL